MLVGGGEGEKLEVRMRAMEQNRPLRKKGRRTDPH